MITIRSQAPSCPREREARRRTMSTIATIQAMVATTPRSQSQSTVQPYGFGDGAVGCTPTLAGHAHGFIIRAGDKGTRETMKPHVSAITLGVKDVNRAKEFYRDGLGWPIQQEVDDWVCFILGDGSSALTLYPWVELANDAGVAADGSGFRGVTLAYNVRSEARVDAVLAEAERAGGAIIQPARRTEWGGYSGYFADPDGHLWEVATGSTQLPFSE
jgi:catechol 2,3-dioxygenase-like lactoylglutathione lyase family enzyme